MTPPAAPRISPPTGPTKPEAGVTVARPAITPVTAPTSDGLPCFFHSMADQTMAALTAARCVTAIAMPAPPSAASWLPPLKPNQPTQSIAAPAAVIPGLWGGWIWSGKPCLEPNTAAATSAADPALKWTTKPPAKSMTPSSPSQPPPQTQWQMGE